MVDTTVIFVLYKYYNYYNVLFEKLRKGITTLVNVYVENITLVVLNNMHKETVSATS